MVVITRSVKSPDLLAPPKCQSGFKQEWGQYFVNHKPKSKYPSFLPGVINTRRSNQSNRKDSFQLIIPDHSPDLKGVKAGTQGRPSCCPTQVLTSQPKVHRNHGRMLLPAGLQALSQLSYQPGDGAPDTCGIVILPLEAILQRFAMLFKTENIGVLS